MMDTYSFENYQKIVEYERNKAEIENQELKSKLAETQDEKQQLQEDKQQLESKLAEREEENQTFVSLLIEMSLKVTGDEELSINEVAEKVPNLTIDEIRSVWYEYKKNKDNEAQ
jgi:predicted nuclease with TOPRIM domain